MLCDKPIQLTAAAAGDEFNRSTSASLFVSCLFDKWNPGRMVADCRSNASHAESISVMTSHVRLSTRSTQLARSLPVSDIQAIGCCLDFLIAYTFDCYYV